MFQSILFVSGADAQVQQNAPDCFGDLNLDQVVATATAGREEYNLAPFFFTSLSTLSEVNYRYDIFRDFQNPDLLNHVRAFAEAMRSVRRRLAEREKHYYSRQKQSAFLEAVDGYCEAVTRFAASLAHVSLSSVGLAAFREFIAAYVASDHFALIVSDTKRLMSDLAAVRYRLHIQGKRITVNKYEDEPDYRASTLETFDKFKESAGKEYRFDSRFVVEMNHVEAAILDLVAQLFPDVFASLDEYNVRHAQFLDDTVVRFDREAQFYIAYLEYGDPLKRAGLSFCFPLVSDRSKEICGADAFDLALATHLIHAKAQVVTNNFFLKDPERIFIVTGPNQGGKTTFARMLGQLHYLASIGVPIPGGASQLFLFDHLFAHFEREENIRNLSGKLEDELLRIRAILSAATPKSILIMNESFLSTTLNDAIFLSKKVMARIVELDMICVSVTFLDEMASFSASTVSEVSTVNPVDTGERTFKVIRRPADGLAYAAAIAEKYRLTYGGVKRRIAANLSTGARS